MSIERIVTTDFAPTTHFNETSFIVDNHKLDSEGYITQEKRKDGFYDYLTTLLQEKPELHDEEFLMKDIAGFNPTRLVASYMDLHHKMTSRGESLKEINTTFSEMVSVGIRTYGEEFLYRSPVLQTRYEVREVNGVLSVVSPIYDANSPLHTHVSLKEREGASFDAVINLEQAILNAKQHSTLLYGSPEGWNAVGLPFVEGQMHVVNISDNEITDTCLRVSLGLADFKALVESLSQEEIEENNEHELIKRITRTVIYQPKDITPTQVLQQIKQIKGTDIAWNRMKLQNGVPVFDKSFSFEDINSVLDRRSFLDTSEDVKRIIAGLSQYLEINADIDDESLASMVRRIGQTALMVSESIGYEVGEIKEKTIQNGDYSGAAKYASEGMGCDAPSAVSSQAREAQYALEGIDGICVQCGDYSKTICGWCIKCAEAGENYKKKKIESVQTSEINEDKRDFYGSFIGIFIAGFFSALSKN